MIDIFCFLILLSFIIVIGISCVILTTKYISSYLLPILKPYFLIGEYGDIISEYSLIITVGLIVGGILGLGSFFTYNSSKCKGKK